jgi:signal transduction histidine kinase
VESQEEERRRIARDLHDSTGQTMAALVLNLSLLEQKAGSLDEAARAALTDSLQLASQASVGLRDLSYLLHPPALDEMGLEGALHWFVDNFAKRTGMQVDLFLAKGLPQLPEPARLTAFRVVQEALSNVYRHSGSKTAKVSVAHENSGIEVEVVDKGRGMTPGHGLGLGLLGMRERVKQQGGSLNISSGGGGTSIKAVLPLGEGKRAAKPAAGR